MKTPTPTRPEFHQHPWLRTALLAVTMALASHTAGAQAGIPWNSLSESEQELLGKYRGQWSQFDHGEQEKLRSGARRYLRLSPKERRAVEQKHKQYRKMTPREQQRLREEYRKQKKKKK